MEVPMKGLKLAAYSAALAASFAMPISANALSLVISNVANAKGYMNNAAMSATTPAMEPNEATLANAMSVNAEAVNKIKTLGSDADVQLVRVGSLTKANATSFTSSMTSDQQAINNLRTAIESNSALSDALKKQSISLASVIGAKVDVAGHLVLYSNT
jgi:hypothetical protein